MVDKTYFPVNDDYPQTNVAAQENDPNSYLNRMRFLLKTRQGQPALRRGKFEFVETGSETILAFVRYLKQQRVLCLFNLSDEVQTLPKDFLESMQPVRDLLHPENHFEDHVRVCDNEPHLLELPPHSAHWFI